MKSDIKAKQEELNQFAKEREEFIKKTEGVRPKVNDPRAVEVTRSALTSSEVEAQNKAIEAWENTSLKETTLKKWGRYVDGKLVGDIRDHVDKV